MINTDKLLELFIKNLHLIFGEKIIFIGLQGSYTREEATENSDIDVVIIAAIFVIQALIYHNKGIYLKTKKQLFNEADIAEKEIIKTAAEPDNLDFEYASKILIEWSQNLILNYSE